MRIVKNILGLFLKKGTRRPILNYEYSIDTGTAKSVCCKKPRYGSYESNIIMEHVNILLGNNWIETM